MNQKRRANGLNPVASHVINGGEMLSDDKGGSFTPTETVSSSSGRVALLGELLKAGVSNFDIF